MLATSTAMSSTVAPTGKATSPWNTWRNAESSSPTPNASTVISSISLARDFRTTVIWKHRRAGVPACAGS